MLHGNDAWIQYFYKTSFFFLLRLSEYLTRWAFLHNECLNLPSEIRVREHTVGIGTEDTKMCLNVEIGL